MCYTLMLSIVTSFEINYFSFILTKHFRPSVMSLHLSAELRTVNGRSDQGIYNDLFDWLGNLNFVDFTSAKLPGRTISICLRSEVQSAVASTPLNTHCSTLTDEYM